MAPTALAASRVGEQQRDGWDQQPAGMLGRREVCPAVTPHCLLGGPQPWALFPSLGPSQQGPCGDWAPRLCSSPHNLPLGAEKEVTQLRSEKADDAQEGGELDWLSLHGRGALEPTEDTGRPGSVQHGATPSLPRPQPPSFLEV